MGYVEIGSKLVLFTENEASGIAHCRYVGEVTLTSLTKGGNAATRFQDIWLVLLPTTDESIAPVDVDP